MAQPLRWVVRFPRPQRKELERLATQAGFLGLACFNARCLGAGEQSDFYFDPHTKQYTGQENARRMVSLGRQGDAQRLYPHGGVPD